MNVEKILHFYQINGLFESNHKYLEKFSHLDFFKQFDQITIESIHEYVLYRRSSGVKNSTINREFSIAQMA